jgi:hypothetical protein
MKQTRTFELKIEKSETLVIRRRRPVVVAWCAACGRETEMFSPEEAAGLAKTSPRKIYQAIEAGEIHFVEQPEDFLVVCSESLLSRAVERELL